MITQAKKIEFLEKELLELEEKFYNSKSNVKYIRTQLINALYIINPQFYKLINNLKNMITDNLQDSINLSNLFPDNILEKARKLGWVDGKRIYITSLGKYELHYYPTDYFKKLFID